MDVFTKKQTEIQSLTIINQTGTKTYSVGSEYNGLKLDNIKDHSIEYSDSFHSIFIGFTADGEKVFETYNAPTDVEYREVE